MPVGNAGKRPPLSAKVTGIPPQTDVASATANPSTLTRLFRRIKDRVFAMGHVTRILWFAPRRCVRCGQSHAGVCGVGGRRQNKCCGEYKRGQPPAFGRAGNTTNACLLVVLPLAVKPTANGRGGHADASASRRCANERIGRIGRHIRHIGRAWLEPAH